jgi:predicted  nucleic acid-binding Zn-ribbon protein
MSNTEAESLNLRTKQKENDIENLNGKIMRLDDDISALSDQIKQTKDDKKKEELKIERDGLRHDLIGLREDIKRSETQLSNLKQGNFDKFNSFYRNRKQEKERT